MFVASYAVGKNKATSSNNSAELRLPHKSGDEVLGIARLRKPGRLGKIAWLPGEAFIGYLMIVSGLGRLFGTELLSPASPLALARLVGGFYLLGGLLTLLGLVVKKTRQVEMGGLVCLVAGIVVTTTTGLTYHVGVELFKDIAIFGGVAAFVFTRMRTILRNRYVIMVEPLKVGDDQSGN